MAACCCLGQEACTSGVLHLHYRIDMLSAPGTCRQGCLHHIRALVSGSARSGRQQEGLVSLIAAQRCFCPLPAIFHCSECLWLWLPYSVHTPLFNPVQAACSTTHSRQIL